MGLGSPDTEESDPGDKKWAGGQGRRQSGRELNADRGSGWQVRVPEVDGGTRAAVKGSRVHCVLSDSYRKFKELSPALGLCSARAQAVSSTVLDEAGPSRPPGTWEEGRPWGWGTGIFREKRHGSGSRSLGPPPPAEREGPGVLQEPQKSDLKPRALSPGGLAPREHLSCPRCVHCPRRAGGRVTLPACQLAAGTHGPQGCTG